MAYRRRAGISKAATFKDEMMLHHQHPISSSSSSRSPFEEGEEDDDGDDHIQNQNQSPIKKKEKGNEIGGPTSTSASASASLAARATRASAAHRDSSGYAYAYASPAAAAAHRHSDHFRSLSFPKGSPSPHLHSHSHSQSDIGSGSGSGSESTSSMSMMTTDSVSPKHGFWGVLASKAKSILEDDHQHQHLRHQHQHQHPSHHHNHNQMYASRQSSDRDSAPRTDNNAGLRNRLDSITSSFNNFGDSLGNAFEEGRSLMENKTSDIIQETRTRTAEFIQGTRKLQLRRRGPSSDALDQPTVVQNTSWQRPVGPSVQTNSVDNQQTQLKASRDVAMATAAKAKLLLRELKTVKADLAFAKERCSQLEEENKRLRVNREKGDNPADDDLIRLQLETLLAEKARLAHENSIYARENWFLREIVEYHQLSMQNVVYLDEGDEEGTEGYPFSIDDANVLPSTSMSPISASFLPEVSSLSVLSEENEHMTESPKDVSLASSFSFPSAAPPERTESSEVPASVKLEADEATETYCDTEPSIDAYDAPTRSSVLSP